MRPSYSANKYYKLYVDVALPNTTSLQMSCSWVEFDDGGTHYKFKGASIVFTNNIITITQVESPYVSRTLTPSDVNPCEIIFRFVTFTSGDLLEPYYTIIEDGSSEITNYGFIIELYNLKCKRNVVKKLSTATNYVYVDWIHGNLKEETNVLKPSFIFEYSGQPNFNYIHVYGFSRYYFVDSIVSVRNGLWRINCTIDVLQTHSTEIYNQKCFIVRSQSSGDSSLVDERRPLKNEPTITFTDVTGGTYANTTYDQNSALFLLSCISAKDELPFHNEMDPPDVLNSGLPPILSNTYDQKNIETYVLTSSMMNSTFDCIKKHSSDLASFIINVINIPFNLYPHLAQTGTPPVYETYDVQIGSKYLNKDTGAIDNSSYGSSGVTAYRFDNGAIIPYLVVADFTITSTYSGSKKYLNYEPYSHYEIYISYYGWVELNAKDILDKNLWVYYAVDFITGNATAYVYNKTDKKVVFSAPCQIGFGLPISTTNKDELKKQSDANILNMTLGVVGSGVSIATGLSSGNALALVGGVMGATKTIANGVNNYMHRFQKGQATSGGSLVSRYSPHKVIIKTTTNEPLSISESDYAEEQGYPCNTYGSLSTLTGYTEIGEIHYKPTIWGQELDDEIKMLENALKSGVIL